MSRSSSLLCLAFAFACVLTVSSVVRATPKPLAPRFNKRLTVYLHTSGGRFVASDRDDASRFASNIVKTGGLPHADIPAYQGRPGEWDEIKACVRTYFTGLPLDLVDQKPADDDFLMLVVGGRSPDIGYQKLWGLSSTRNHKVVERGVGFVFSAAHPQNKDRVQRLCETTAHEIGHLLGLPHTDSCDDLMTSNNTCVRQAPIYGFRPDNWSGLVNAVDRWKTKRYPDFAAPIERAAAHPRSK